MRMSTLLAPTLRDNPSDAEVISHQLLIRAGYIRRLANGVYNYLPLMWRVLRKVEQIVREEMDRAGAQELLMPILQPAEVWQASGRWDIYGDLMMRVKDRHDRWYGLAPTAEEVITDIATREIQSYRQLPVNLYQIQTKYRDEIRPRFGLLRGREFIMKDAYSFHSSQADLDREYEVMAETYTRIFARCGLDTRKVRSDSGTIGGSVSHEYMVLTKTAEGGQESGENDVFFCNHCDYAANAERANSILPTSDVKDGSSFFSERKVVDTPNCTDIAALSAFLKVPPTLIGKALLYMKDDKYPFLVMIRGDLEAQEVKVINAVHALDCRLANEEEVKRYTGSSKGYVGLADWSPVKLVSEHFSGLTLGFASNSNPDQKLTVILDASVRELNHFVIANNQAGVHVVGYNWPADCSWNNLLDDNVRDLRTARIGDGCPECDNGRLNMTRGIEVGNIFQLGTKYSQSMGATYTAEDSSEQPFVMGCYGIGVTRTAAAALEWYHDANGMIWPIPIAPYQVVVVAVNNTDDAQMGLAKSLYDQMVAAGIECVLDDRPERAGVKFKDADLMGFPIRVTAGKKAADGILELKLRHKPELTDVPQADVLAFVQDQIAQAMANPVAYMTPTAEATHA